MNEKELKLKIEEYKSISCYKNPNRSLINAICDDIIRLINSQGKPKNLSRAGESGVTIEKSIPDCHIPAVSSTQSEHTAWCPICFDALEVVEKIDDNKMISGHYYNCFGCGKFFELNEFDIGERTLKDVDQDKGEISGKEFGEGLRNAGLKKADFQSKAVLQSYPKSRGDKTEYKCGHKGKPVFLDDNELSMVGYFEWKESVGFEGDKSKCWDCWCKEENKAVPKTMHEVNGEPNDKLGKHASCEDCGMCKTCGDCINSCPEFPNIIKIEMEDITT